MVTCRRLRVQHEGVHCGVVRGVGMLIATGALALAGCAGAGHARSSGPARHTRATAMPSRRPASSLASPARHRTLQARRPAVAHLVSVHDPGQVTGSLTGLCKARDHGRLPDRRCTPGAVDPAVTQADIGTTICTTGYTERVRPPESQTEDFKFSQAYPAYGIASGATSELDHLVPLELGGANDAANLWPEAGSLPNPKDAVENALKTAVCDGEVSLARAQRAIARDWETAETRLGLGSGPAPAPQPQPTHAADKLRCAASVSTTSPADYHTVYVYVRTAPGVKVTTVAHYKTTDNQKSAVTDEAGRATIAYYISGATPGFTVTVSVTASASSKTATCATSFTPVS
jgi:hypothetical protein